VTHQPPQTDADRFDDAVARLGDRARFAAEHDACGRQGVAVIGLVALTLPATAWSRDLEHFDALQGEALRKPGSVGAGAFDAGTANGPAQARPLDQGVDAATRRGKYPGFQLAAE